MACGEVRKYRSMKYEKGADKNRQATLSKALSWHSLLRDIGSCRRCKRRDAAIRKTGRYDQVHRLQKVYVRLQAVE